MPSVEADPVTHEAPRPIDTLHPLDPLDALGAGDSLAEVDEVDPLAQIGDTAGTDVKPSSLRLRRIVLAVDVVALIAGWAVQPIVAAASGAPGRGMLALAAETTLVAVLGVMLLSAVGVYRRRISRIRRVELIRLAGASLVLGAFAFVLGQAHHPRSALPAAAAACLTWFGILAVERGLMREWIQGRRATGEFGAPVVVVGGTAAATTRVAQFLQDHPVLGFEVRGFVTPALTAPGSAEADDEIRRLGDLEDLATVTRRAGLSGAFLDAGSLTGDQLARAVRALGDANLHAHVSTNLAGVDHRRISVTPLADETFLHVAPLGLTRRQHVMKRALDLALGGLALVVASPVLLVAAIAIWATDRGPVLFRQERVGQSGERFTLYKLRTMVPDAEARRDELQHDNERTGPLFKMPDDPRVTAVGRILRATSIDELPQLFNVLEGTMSLVGPRPALPDEVQRFDDELAGRLAVKPGMTGMWQVEARDLASFDLYRRYDLLYVRNWSLGLDLSIIARTVTVIGVRGAFALVPRRLRRADVLE